MGSRLLCSLCLKCHCCLDNTSTVLLVWLFSNIYHTKLVISCLPARHESTSLVCESPPPLPLLPSPSPTSPLYHFAFSIPSAQVALAEVPVGSLKPLALLPRLHFFFALSLQLPKPTPFPILDPFCEKISQSPCGVPEVYCSHLPSSLL